MSTVERTPDPRRGSFALFFLSSVAALYVVFGYGVYWLIEILA